MQQLMLMRVVLSLRRRVGAETGNWAELIKLLVTLTVKSCNANMDPMCELHCAAPRIRRVSFGGAHATMDADESSAVTEPTRRGRNWKLGPIVSEPSHDRNDRKALGTYT